MKKFTKIQKPQGGFFDSHCTSRSTYLCMQTRHSDSVIRQVARCWHNVYYNAASTCLYICTCHIYSSAFIRKMHSY